jgi:3-oxoadipyl-CoA thiolase
MRDEVWIVSAVRTPIGRHGGALARVRPDDLGALAVAAAVERAGVAGSAIDDVILGCANQAGEDSRNVARMAALLAGLPVDVPGQTVNRLCGSGLQAVNSAFHAIRSDQGDIMVAGGVESMSRAPYVLLKPEEGYARGAPPIADTVLGWRFVNSRFPDQYTVSLGETAERVADKYGITREQQDAFALRSQERAAAALETGRFGAELVGVNVPARKGESTCVERDEHPRPDTTLEQLARLAPAFRKNGTVTAGNSSGLNDGAAALVLARAESAKAVGLTTLARVVATAAAGVEPDQMGMGPVPATRRALERAGLKLNQIRLVELNEAFAAQACACVQELGIDPDIINVNGGAIALGHPLGCSGARILTTLIHELRRRGGGYGLASMCIGVGQGITTIVEVFPE